jgi:hypothetical protein
MMGLQTKRWQASLRCLLPTRRHSEEINSLGSLHCARRLLLRPQHHPAVAKPVHWVGADSL